MINTIAIFINQKQFHGVHRSQFGLLKQVFFDNCLTRAQQDRAKSCVHEATQMVNKSRRAGKTCAFEEDEAQIEFNKDGNRGEHVPYLPVVSVKSGT